MDSASPRAIFPADSLAHADQSVEHELNGEDKELTTVSVPAPFRDIFLRAQEFVSRYFSDRHDDPSHGSITISGERYILVRASSMSVEFFELVTSLYREKGADAAVAVAKNLLYDVAHAIGKADAKAFQTRMELLDPVERLSAGPIHFAHAGWANVLIHPESQPAPNDDFYLLYDHPYSFEADAWLRRGTKVDFPVCVMNSGYSSGWCEDSFGIPLVAAELECRARGDERCRFIMAPPSRIEQHIAHYQHRDSSAESRAMWRGPVMPVEVPEFFQRKRIEEELRASQEALEQRVLERTREIAFANQKLTAEMAERQRVAEERRRLELQLREVQKLESIGVLAGGIAHDFNNLLVGVMGNTNLALHELPDDSPVRAYLRDIESAATRAAELVRQMLAYAGKGRLVIEHVDLSALMREMLSLLTSSVSKKAELRFEPAESGPVVEADATQLRQVAMNLITNASDALGDHPGVITVRTGVVWHEPGESNAAVGALIEAGYYAHVTVTDSGNGMDAATRERMFEPFFTTKFTGRGLGLASALGIVRAHGGAIRVVSDVGVGTEVRVLFPVVVGVVPHPTPVRPVQAVHPVRGTVLVADDEPLARDVVRRVLVRMGLTPIVAVDGEDALAQFTVRRGEIDLVLLDLTMPKLGGIESFHAMRRLDGSLKALLMSGYTDAESHEHARRAGFLGFVQKPYRLDELTDCIRAALSGEARSAT